MKIITPGMSLSPARSSAAFSSSLSRIITPEKMAASSRPALRATRQEVHVVVAKALSRGPYAGVPCPMSMPMCRPASASLAVSLARSRTAAASAAEVEYSPVHSVAAHLHRHIVSRCLPQRGLPRRRCHVLPLHFAVLIPSAGRKACLIALKFRTILYNKHISLATDLVVRSQLTPIVVQQPTLEVSVR